MYCMKIAAVLFNEVISLKMSTKCMLQYVASHNFFIAIFFNCILSYYEINKLAGQNYQLNLDIILTYIHIH